MILIENKGFGLIKKLQSLKIEEEFVLRRRYKLLIHFGVF